MHLFVFTRYFYNRFDGAVSITVALEELDIKVEGSNPSKTFFFFAFANMQEIVRDLHICMDYAHVKRLHSVKLRSLYRDTAIIEKLDKFCMEEKKSGRKRSLHRVWDRTAALTGVSRSTAQKIVEEKKKAQDEQQQPKQPPSSTSKV